MSKIPRSQLSKVVAGLSLGAKDSSLGRSIAAYLLEERRVNELDSLLRDIQKDWAKAGYVDVLAKVARPLPQVVYDELGRPFSEIYHNAKSINVTPVIDSSVIGGVILELADQRMDISIKRRLQRFKKAINVKEG